MAFINDTELDALLASINTDVEALHICSAEPTTVTEATTTYGLGNKATPATTGPQDKSPNGRELQIDAISDGAVTVSGDASHWALVKTSATERLLATGSLASTQTVTNGNTFTLTAFTIGVPDAV
jgi:hypothetical protein